MIFGYVALHAKMLIPLCVQSCHMRLASITASAQCMTTPISTCLPRSYNSLCDIIQHAIACIKAKVTKFHGYSKLSKKTRINDTVDTEEHLPRQEAQSSTPNSQDKKIEQGPSGKISYAEKFPASNLLQAVLDSPHTVSGHDGSSPPLRIKEHATF